MYLEGGGYRGGGGGGGVLFFLHCSVGWGVKTWGGEGGEEKKH